MTTDTPGMTNWVLRATDVTGEDRWRWLLSGPGDRVTADHEVDLDPGSAEQEAFADLDGYLRRNAAPDDWVSDEARIVAWLGDWIAAEVFGPEISARLAEPDTVLVEVPAGAEFLLDRPLELARLNGGALATRGPRLVYRQAGERLADKEPVGAELRVLALFSMPERTSVLALRRERHELSTLVRRLAKQTNRALHIRVVQYGVTRERLRAVAEESPGWDVLHVAGHGEHGVILLEKPDGDPDPVPTEDLIELLRPARHRLKLAVLGTCHSGAATAAATLHRLGLTDRAATRTAPEGAATTAPAIGLVNAFGVAAIGMRYPVADQFAISLTAELYQRLLTGTPVDRALSLAIPAAAGPTATSGRPALSAGTPALFGTRAAGLRLTAPARTPTFDPARQRMTGFPDEPTRFVGRTRLLVDASAALAPQSGHTGVLLLGMAGAGKSTAAVELAYQHRDSFGGLAWWRAPDRDTDPGAALGLLAEALETQLPDFHMTEVTSNATGFRRFLPQLTALLRDEAVLLVLDNLETLLTRTGSWRDPLWTDLIQAITNHGGVSRVVLTSRTTPTGLSPRVPVLPVHALTLAESALLARELPRLGALLHENTTIPSTPEDRALVREVINVVQGHPTLLELADATAADPDRLRERLAATTQGAELNSFFTTGTTDLDATQFLRALTTWTTTTVDDLPEPARRLAELLACLEEPDRQSGILDALWPRRWEPDPAPPLAEALVHLSTAALVHTEPGEIQVHRLHPGVAEAIRSGVPPVERSEVDDLVGGMWHEVCRHRLTLEQRDEVEETTLVVHAALAAAPYLIRLSYWPHLIKLINLVPGRDRSPGTALRVLGYLQQCLDADPEPADRLLAEATHAITLGIIDPAAAETRLRALLARSTALGEDELTAMLASQLSSLLRDHGRLSEALELATQAAAIQDDFWSHLDREVAVLQNLALLGRSAEALERAITLLVRVDAVAAEQADSAGIPRWHATERLLDAACRAAIGVGEYARALEFNQRIRDIEQRRGAGPHEQASTQFNQSTLLIRLGRTREADRQLRHCQQVFQELGDPGKLGMVFSARAQLARRPEQAIELEQLALRYVYQRGDVNSIAACHHNLGGYLAWAARRADMVAAHLLAAALLWRVTGNDEYLTVLGNLSSVVPRPAGRVLPATVAELTGRVEVLPGVRFGEVFAGLLPDPGERESLFAEIAEFAETHLLLRGPKDGRSV